MDVALQAAAAGERERGKETQHHLLHCGSVRIACAIVVVRFLPASNISICNSKRETFERRIVT